MATFLYRNTIDNTNAGIDAYWELTTVRQTAEFDSPLDLPRLIQ